MRPFVVLAGLLLTASCRPKPAAEWHDEGTHRWRALDVPRASKAGFSLLARSKTGVDFTNSVDLEQALANRHLVHGSGVALGDVDGDGLVDIYLAHMQGKGRLYRNLGGLRFEDITVRSGIAPDSGHHTGAVFVDVDGDGDLDLFVNALGGPNALFSNDGRGRFTDVTARSNLTSARASTTATFGDVDGDGDLDLYVATYKVRTALDIYTPQERAFDQVVRQRGERYEIAERFRDQYRVVVRPELNIVSLIQRADPDLFYLNDGTGRFTAEPLTGGRFRDEAGKPLASEPEDFGLAARFQDVDSDGDPDLYVCNDFEDPDQFWINDGTGHFRAISRVGIRATSNSCMSVDFSDVDRDGNVDIFTADMLSRDTRRLKTQTPTHTALPKLIGEIENRPQLQRNSLFRNRGDGTFAQVAAFAGVEASDWSWGSMFLDVDLDGYEDLLIGTGHPWDLMDSDTWDRIRTTVTGTAWRRELTLFPLLALPNVAFRNNGDLTFTDMGSQWGFSRGAGITHGLASADLDGDGDLDIVTNRLNSPAEIFRNDVGAPRIMVSLVGQAPNRQGIGSKIRVQGGPVAEQTKEVSAGGLYLSSSATSYAFAAGVSSDLTISVDWRSGRRTTIRGARPNRTYEISEPRDSGAAPSARPADSSKAYFTDVSELLSHRHEESPFDEFRRQPLLPWRFSQLGPGLTWYDIDGDGDEDLVIPSGKGGRLAVFRNDRGTLRREGSARAVAPYDQTSVLGLPDGSSGTRLLVGQSSYEASTPAEALATASVIEFPARSSPSPVPPRTAVRGDTSSIGALAAADYDADGDLDLFVAGRIAPGAYPGASSSRMLLNHAGAFVLDSANATVLRQVGLISGATFSDIDGDGDADLVLAVEWGPVKVLINEGGRFSDHTVRLGLDRLKSRWNGVATGDLDGDGRLDIIATSWGRNVRNRPEPGRPLYLYWGNFDTGFTLDLLEAQLDARIGGVAPLQTLSRLGVAVPALRRTARTFARYADMTIDELLGGSSYERLEITTLEHTLLLNRGDRFEARALPAESQLAPAFHVGIADFDGDGAEDVFLSQNFFGTEIGMPRYDAGTGLWLRGDGTGRLEPVPPSVSGIAVHGEQRGAAVSDFDGDGRIDLAISQNGAQTRLFRNRGAKPGVRVRLIGPPGNPHGYGSRMRLVYGSRMGPVREVQAGSGYWSVNGAIQVLGAAAEVTGVEVRWPGGKESRVAIPAGTREVTVSHPSAP